MTDIKLNRLTATQALLYAQVMALDEMVNRGEITKDQQLAIAQRTDEIIANMVKGYVHQRDEHGIYQAREATQEEREAVAGQPAHPVNVLKIGG